MFTSANMRINEQGDTETRYEGDFTVTCNGTSLWGHTAGRVVRVTGATAIKDADTGYVHVSVEHDSDWDIYTDTAFEAAISNALGFEVHFTEQGMQDNCLASME